MGYQSSIRYASQPALALDFRQQLQRRKVLGLPGGSALWLAAAKISVLILGVALCVSLWLGAAISEVNVTIQASGKKLEQLKDEQISLLAERASLMSERQIQRLAAEKLALFVPEQEQVYKLR